MKRINRQQFLYLSFRSFISNNSAEFQVLGWGGGAWRRTKRPSKSIINHRGTSSVGPGLQFTRELIMIENHRKADFHFNIIVSNRTIIDALRCNVRSVRIAGNLMGQRLLLKYIFWKLDSFLKRNAYRGKWKGSENAELVNSSRIRANCSIHIIFRLTSTTAGVTRDVSARLIILSLSIKKNKKTAYRSLFRLLITFDAFLFSITET